MAEIQKFSITFRQAVAGKKEIRVNGNGENETAMKIDQAHKNNNEEVKLKMHEENIRKGIRQWTFDSIIHYNIFRENTEIN